MPDTLFCLLADGTKLQQSCKTMRKGSSYEPWVIQLITLACSISGSFQGRKAQMIKALYKTRTLRPNLPEGSQFCSNVPIYFFFKASYLFTPKYVKTFFDFRRDLARHTEPPGPWLFLQHIHRL